MGSEVAVTMGESLGSETRENCCWVELEMVGCPHFRGLLGGFGVVGAYELLGAGGGGELNEGRTGVMTFLKILMDMVGWDDVVVRGKDKDFGGLMAWESVWDGGRLYVA
ncbi:hypothetical protein Tco_0563837 [Tanacetum coccineum]